MNENLKGDKNHEYGVDWGLAHPMFLRMAENTNDIGLFRLDKDAIIRQAKIEISLITFFPLPSNNCFRTGSIQPICLPNAFSDKMDVSDEDKEVKTDP